MRTDEPAEAGPRIAVHAKLNSAVAAWLDEHAAEPGPALVVWALVLSALDRTGAVTAGAPELAAKARMAEGDVSALLDQLAGIEALERIGGRYFVNPAIAPQPHVVLAGDPPEPGGPGIADLPRYARRAAVSA